MNVGSLFSGIGGLDYGLARAGMRHVFFCESDAYRRDVLRARFPGVPAYEDVREVASNRQPDLTRDRPDASSGQEREAWRHGRSIDLLCGGFPCQDLSVAGRRAGLAGVRSGLFHEFARVADALQPGWLLVENVPGLLSSNGGRDFGVVLGTLADVGYGLAWRILDSRYFGVPQRRRRVFIVGAVADDDPRAAAERAGQVLAVGSRCPGHSPTRGEARQDAAVASLSGLGTGGPDDNDGQGGRLVTAPLSHGSNPNSNMAGRRRVDDENLIAAFNWQADTTRDDSLELRSEYTDALQANQGKAILNGASVRRLMPVECERLQALPDGWTDLGDSADSRRYAALGDAVTATVAEWIGRRLMQSEAA